MINRRSYKTLIIFTTITTALVILFFIPQTGLQTKSKQYLGKLVSGSEQKNETEGGFNEGKWWFQNPMPQYKLPHFGAAEMHAAPHNWQGSGHETIATFYASRDADMHDPYFLAAQQIVYRVLWDPKTKSNKYPMTVFVSPFISEEQRQYFRAAGALVRELPLRPYVPEHAGTAGRLRDMFSKLEMWHHVEFSRIAYLDSDAFPIDNIDEIFELAKWQMCKEDLLPEGDRSVAKEICRYTFTGFEDFDGINAGVLVFSPSEPMYGRLIRESLNHSNIDDGYMEQSLLHYTFRADGPFPPTSTLPQPWNAGPYLTRDGIHQYIVHHKLWATEYDAPEVWYKNTFRDNWDDMLAFYNSDEFKKIRKDAGPLTHLDMGG